MPTIISGDGTITGLTSTGISAVQQLPAGSVLQVVNATYSTQISTSSSTFSDTGLTATITPKFSTSKILVTFTIPISIYIAGIQAGGNLRIVRNSTAIYGQNAYGLYLQAATGSGAIDMNNYTTISYLDSPATTSATTYKIQQNAISGAIYAQNGNETSTITLMEIAA